VAVIGAGPIGLAITAHLIAGGIRPWLLDVSARRRAFASGWSGLEAVDPGSDAALTLRHETGGELATIVFDATGNATSMRAAFDLVAPGGRLVLVGLFQGDLAFHDPEFHRRELTVMGSRNATSEDFRRSIDLLATRSSAIERWITHRTTLDGVPAMFEALEDPASGVIKAMVDV
jgi:threonine dehydrogenase-like Zn-dependent dehydrogenase